MVMNTGISCIMEESGTQVFNLADVALLCGSVENESMFSGRVGHLNKQGKSKGLYAPSPSQQKYRSFLKHPSL